VAERGEPFGILVVAAGREGVMNEARVQIAAAIDRYRQLASANPAAFEPDLARALTNLAAARANLRRYAEARETSISTDSAGILTVA